MSARGRLRRLEEVGFHATFGTVYPCTDREAALLEGAGLVGAAEEHTERTDPRDQERRERWLFANRHGFEPWREKVRRVEEEQRAYAEASKQRDRELLEENRAAVGLPPLTLEQITKSGLEGTTRGEGGSRCPNARE